MKTAIVTGALTYAAARYIFDTSAGKAMVAAVMVAALGYYIANLSPGRVNSVDFTPQV